MNPPATDLELVDALAQRLRGLPPPSQPFTVYTGVYIFEYNPSDLYDKYGGGADCVYFFCNQSTRQDGWKVAAGTQRVLDGGGAVVSWKDTLVFHESRWLPSPRWTMDEVRAKYQEGFSYSYSDDWLRLYRLRRLGP
ncbi:unnamed protein product [Urochloa humidicola]